MDKELSGEVSTSVLPRDHHRDSAGDFLSPNLRLKSCSSASGKHGGKAELVSLPTCHVRGHLHADRTQSLQ